MSRVNVGFCFFIMVAFFVSGCAKHLPGLSSLPRFPVQKQTSAFVYQPPTIRRTYIGAHQAHNGLVEGAHYVYWVDEAGHWSVPLTPRFSLKHSLIEPALPVDIAQGQ
jgi:hypothetical protein